MNPFPIYLFTKKLPTKTAPKKGADLVKVTSCFLSVLQKSPYLIAKKATMTFNGSEMFNPQCAPHLSIRSMALLLTMLRNSAQRLCKRHQGGKKYGQHDKGQEDQTDDNNGSNLN